MKKVIRYKIIDNFLSNRDYSELMNNIFPTPINSIKTGGIGWEYANAQELQATHEEPEKRFKEVTDIELLGPMRDWYFHHLFQYGGYQSQVLHYLGALLTKIDYLALWRIQANFTVQQEKIRGRSPFHIDYSAEPMRHTSMITSIYYVNTTNGPTILEDGTEIECRANRLVSYPYDTYHAGVSCTDQPFRIVINLNYFKEMNELYE